jgi:hypothetical protein
MKLSAECDVVPPPQKVSFHQHCEFSASNPSFFPFLIYHCIFMLNSKKKKKKNKNKTKAKAKTKTKRKQNQNQNQNDKRRKEEKAKSTERNEP